MSSSSRSRASLGILKPLKRRWPKNVDVRQIGQETLCLLGVNFFWEIDMSKPWWVIFYHMAVSKYGWCWTVFWETFNLLKREVSRQKSHEPHPFQSKSGLDSRSSSSPDVWNACEQFHRQGLPFWSFFFWKSAFALLRFYADFKEWSCFEWGELVLTFCHCWRWPLVDMVFNIWFHTSTHLRTDTPNCHQAQASLGRFLDRRTSSVQDASCAASDAQGRLNRLQEQSRTVPGSGHWMDMDGYGWREKERKDITPHWNWEWNDTMICQMVEANEVDAWCMDRSKNCTSCKF